MQPAKVSVTCRNFILLQWKTPKCKYWFLKVLCLDTNMVCSGLLKNNSLCLPFLGSSKCCAACWCNGWRLDIKDLMKLTLSCLSISIKIYITIIYITTFISPSFTRVFFLTATSLAHVMWNVPDKYDKIIVLILS